MNRELQIINQLGLKIAQLEVANAELAILVQELELQANQEVAETKEVEANVRD